NVKNVIVIEELEPFIQNEISAAGANLQGKEYFGRHGELNPDSVKKGLIEAGFLERAKHLANASGSVFHPAYDRRTYADDSEVICNSRNITVCTEENAETGCENINDISEILPPRLPALCSGCPHTAVFYALKKLRVPVMGDIGCYTLGALPPLNAMDSCISMGLAFGAAQGLSLTNSSAKKTAGIMGDSTFFHSGITSLIDAKYNNACFTAIILDNSTTAMTGGQDHPGTGNNLSPNQTISNKIDIKKIIESIGIDEIFTVDTYDYNETYETLKKALDSKKLNAVITNRPCVLYPKKLDAGKKFTVTDGCIGCNLCMQIGCPSILSSSNFNSVNNKPVPLIDNSCIGCSICKDICIFNFIEEAKR
ncbi:MAG: thiamine pyrophosphate-dependent enzyme, partial [bacterium]